MAASEHDAAVYDNSDVSDYSLLSELDTSLRSTSSGYEFADVSADASQLSGGEAPRGRSESRRERGDDDHTNGLVAAISDENAHHIAEQVAAVSPSRRRRPHSARTRNKKKQDLKACMLSMKGQVAFLHQMMQKIAAAEKDSFLLGARKDDDDDHHHHTGGDLSGMSFSLLSPVRKSSTDVIALPDAHFKKQMLFQDNWELDRDYGSEHVQSRSSSRAESSTQGRIAELERENAALKEQIAQHGKHTNDAVTELLDEIEDLKRRLSTAEEENAHLLSVVLQFERIHGSRVQDDVVAAAGSSASTASDSIHDANNNQAKHEEEELHSTQEENDADPDAVTQEEPANVIHVNHERCQAKIHELWQTIKNLKVYVETYRIEKDDLKTQRDEAVASAERAWKDNAKLAGNTNPQQKIKYLQAVKNENAVLLKKIRELQSRLAAQQARKAVKKANGLFEPQDSSQSDLSSFDERILLECADEEDRDDSEPERSKLFRKMWHHNKELEAEILRLREQKRALTTRRSRSESTESSSSAPSSSHSTNSRKSFVTMRGKPSRHLPSVA